MPYKENSTDDERDSFTHALIDMTYGEVIKHAEEGLDKVKKKSAEAPFMISRYTDWLQLEMERLEEEKKGGYYSKLKSQEKIMKIEYTLKLLHSEYCREREKIIESEDKSSELFKHMEKLKVTINK